MKARPNNSPAEHARLRILLRDVTRAAELAGHDHQLVKQLRAAIAPVPTTAGYDPGFPWDPLSYEWWARAGQRVGATAKQLRFAAHWAATGNSAASARFAGHEGRSKQAGHVALRSRAVERLLQEAAAEMDRPRIPLKGKMRDRWRYADYWSRRTYPQLTPFTET